MKLETKDIVIYSSVAINLIILFIVLFPYLGGWLFLSILYGATITAVAIFFLLKSVNISNEFQDILESHIEDTNFFLEKLEPFIAPGSQLEYSDEVKSLISGVLAFKNRLVSRMNAYYEDDETLEPEPIENLLPKRKQQLDPINSNAPIYNLPTKNVPLLDSLPTAETRNRPGLGQQPQHEIPMSRG